jgi:transposase, IS5 family
MLRLYCMQNWFNLSDRQREDALYEIESMRRFAGFAGVTDVLPDETTILNFRHLLEKHNLTLVLLDEINAPLRDQGLLVSRGTLVDTSIIHAPSSTKNQEQARDPEMHQTWKSKQWYFGMKMHIGADVDSGRRAVLQSLPPTRPTSASCPSCCESKMKLSLACRLHQ